jgi:hypothetical protein
VKDSRIPLDAEKSLADQMVALKLVDAGAAAKTPATAYFDNQYVEALEKEGFLKEAWPRKVTESFIEIFRVEIESLWILSLNPCCDQNCCATNSKHQRAYPNELKPCKRCYSPECDRHLKNGDADGIAMMLIKEVISLS